MKTLTNILLALVLVTAINCDSGFVIDTQDSKGEQACDTGVVPDTSEVSDTSETHEDDSSVLSTDTVEDTMPETISNTVDDTADTNDTSADAETQEQSCEVVKFSDPKLDAFMIDQYDTNVDGVLSQTEAEAVTELVIFHHLWQFPDHFNGDFNGIQCFVNLEVLEFEHIGAKDLAPLKALYLLRILNAFGNNIREIGPLSELTELEELYLGYNDGIADLTPLKKLTKLIILSFSGAFTNIEALGNLTNLKQLYFSTGWAIESLVPLDKLTNLEALGIHIGGVTQGPGYYYTPLEWWPFSPISRLTNLKELWINWEHMNSVEFIAPLVNLESFEAPGSKIEDVTAVAQLHSLTHLELSGNYIRDLTPLADLTNLVTLGLGHNGIYDIGPLSGLHNLKVLGLSENSFSDLTPLLSLDALERVWLSDNPIDCEADSDMLGQLPVEDFDELCP